MRQLLIRYRISLSLKIFATLLLLSVVWVFNPELPEGEVAGQWYWLAQTGIIYAVVMLVAVILYRDRRKTTFPEYYYIIIWSFILLGGVEAVWGISQFISGVSIAGSFHNEGLFAGYMAVIFPLALNEWLLARARRKKTLRRQARYYTSLIALTFIILSIVPTQIYSAWFTLVCSGLFVAWHHFGWKRRLHVLWNTRRRKMQYYSAAGVVGVLLLGAVFFSANRENIEKQLFLTKIAFRTIGEKPLTGYGPENFPYAYGETQKSYFQNNTWSEQDGELADSPSHPYNEYLHGAIEWGIPILLCALVFIALSLRQGIRYRRVSASGGMVALLIFSFFSYPMEIPAFIITFVFLLMACIMSWQRIWLAGLAIVIGLFGIHWWRMDDYYLCKEWSRHQRLYHVAAYEAARPGYDILYPSMKNKRSFMYEYGHCLYETRDYDASIEVLGQASKLCCDPMVYNMIGQNYQKKGDFKTAEDWYNQAINLIPGKMYSYYLLAKLYDEPGYRKPGKCKEMAKKVLTMEKNNQSNTARQMRDEAEKLIKLVKN